MRPKIIFLIISELVFQSSGFSTTLQKEIDSPLKTRVTVQYVQDSILPPPNKLIISSFLPTTITAGTGAVLVIKGNNFGMKRGEGGVFFKSSENGGATFIQYSDPSDYLSWSNTEIRMIVPSYIIKDPLHSTPGTGLFIIRDNLGNEAFSSTPLIINYAIHNEVVDSLANMKEILLSGTNDPSKCIRIKLGGDILKNKLAVSTVEKAVNDWRCNTGANIAIQKDVAGNPLEAGSRPAYDHSFEILLNSDLPEMTLARTINYRSKCEYEGKSAIISKEFDIMINKNFNWEYDTTGKKISNDKKDFYAVVLHELGHGLGLDHVNNPADLMYYEVTNLPRKTLKSVNGVPSPSVQGVADMQTRSGLLEKINCEDVYPILTKTACNLEENKKKNFVIYPNPAFGDQASIVWFSEIDENVEVIIYDINGKKIDFLKSNFPEKGPRKVPVNLKNLPVGIYLIEIYSENKKNILKLMRN